MYIYIFTTVFVYVYFYLKSGRNEVAKKIIYETKFMNNQS